MASAFVSSCPASVPRLMLSLRQRFLISRVCFSTSVRIWLLFSRKRFSWASGPNFLLWVMSPARKVPAMAMIARTVIMVWVVMFFFLVLVLTHHLSMC